MFDSYSNWTDIPDESEINTAIIQLDYYNQIFTLLHLELDQSGYPSFTPHPIRRRYWGLLRNREYFPLESRPLILGYIHSVEENLDKSISTKSLAYWLHLYRRIAPKSIGRDKNPITTAIVRATLEAAIQKYAKYYPCSHVGISTEIPPEKILGGLLMSSEFKEIRVHLSKSKQLVLTDFSTSDLKEFYDNEKLAYELWRSAAMLRIVGKGASIIVSDSNDCVFDARSDELDKLVTTFDERYAKNSMENVSASGIVHQDFFSKDRQKGLIFIPTYNVGGVSTEDLSELFDKAFNLYFLNSAEFNFIWVPHNLKIFRDAHLPFNDAFRKKHNVDLDAVLLIIYALLYRVIFIWWETKGRAILRFWQRAYEGPYLRNSVFEEILNFIPVAAEQMSLDSNIYDHNDLIKAFEFLELTNTKRKGIDLAYSGPHYLFLPYDDDHIFIDYTWIIRQLYNLFHGLDLPDQNFKAEYLEEVVRHGKSILPIKQCKSLSGQSKQIDAAFVVGKRLIIVECKAVSWSIGVDRGQPEAIRYRIRKLETALKEVDDKAKWLVKNPQGTNYDIRQYEEIIPLVVSPFVEFIPSLNEFYWLGEGLPRVLTPKELKESLDNGSLLEVSQNTFQIHPS